MTSKVKNSVNLLSKADVARIYNVSRPTAGNWVADALNKANGLQITQEGDRVYILDIAENHAQLASLKEKGTKYKNRAGYLKIDVNPKIYDLLSDSELVELISSLENRYLPNKYRQWGEGAKLYNQYITKQEKASRGYEGVDAIVANNGSLNLNLRQYQQVNIIEIGNVNGATSIPIIKNLKAQNKVLSYTAIGQTDELFNILKTHLNQSIPDLEVQRQVQDMNKLDLKELLFLNRLQSENKKICNLVLFLDYSIGNYINWKEVLKSIHKALGEDDFLYFSTGFYSFSELSFLESLFVDPIIVELNTSFSKFLGISQDCFEIKHHYSKEIDSRLTTLKFTKDVDLNFEIKGQSRVVSFLAGQELIVYIVHSFTEPELFKNLEEIGFEMVNYLLHPDCDETLILVRAKQQPLF